ncbi:MAG: redoxin domain-containing protein [Candidatus Symbiothrix sp.]|jgi:thiol-disulfide isomerase/thioredoxin|nr:redoxin domain-containing protein [Candidatus Symbiothrix sp.]
MRKNIIKILICCVVTVLIFLLGISNISKIKEKENAKKNLQTLNDFCTLNIADGSEFCTGSLTNKPVIVMFMHPECDFCQEEIKQFKDCEEEFKDVFILLITYAPIKQAKKFYTSQKLFQLSNLYFLYDEEMEILNYFDVNVLPSIFIYDDNKKLIFKHKGEIKMEAILKQIKQ